MRTLYLLLPLAVLLLHATLDVGLALLQLVDLDLVPDHLVGTERTPVELVVLLERRVQRAHLREFIPHELAELAFALRKGYLLPLEFHQPALLGNFLRLLGVVLMPKERVLQLRGHVEPLAVELDFLHGLGTRGGRIALLGCCLGVRVGLVVAAGLRGIIGALRLRGVGLLVGRAVEQRADAVGQRGGGRLRGSRGLVAGLHGSVLCGQRKSAKRRLRCCSSS